jgi:Immunoglobulin I-set domain/Fibronectin type III domain
VINYFFFPKSVKPSIDRTNLMPITIKSGLLVALDVDIKGEPAPKVQWFFKEKELVSDTDYRIDNIDYNTKFLIMKGNRALSGKYLIVATNETGEDRAEVEINILGKPSQVGGPIEVSDVNKHGCKLKWQKPEDDGGCPIDYYEIEKLDPLTGQWLPCGKSSTPECTVTGLQEGKPYKFRVKAVNKEGESEPLETEKAIIAKNPFDEPGKPGRPNPTDWDKDFVDLEWQKPASDGGAPIEKYIIQMRDKDKRNWVDACTVPGDRTKGKVTNVQEGHEYEFRVVAVNKAGPSEPSDISKSVVAKPRFLAPHIDRKNLLKKTLHSGQMLHVEADVAGEPAPKVQWYFKDKLVEGSDRIKLENEPYKTTFIIPKTRRADNGVYVIIAKNDSGTDTVEFELEILSKPSPPKGPIQVSDVTAEGCHLKWEAPEDDGGEPIDHYVVERMDTETGRWIPVCESKTPEADVTGLTEGKDYCFRVRAVNAEGESDPLDLEGTVRAKNPFDVPDAPGKPEFQDWSRNHVDLTWKAPESDGGAPILKYIVEKKDNFSSKWQKCMETDGPLTKARVTELIEGNKYQFRVKAVNKGGQSQPSPASEQILAKDRFAAPRIDRSTLKNLTMKGGQLLKMDVKISGEPPPHKYWILNKEKIENKQYDIQIEYEDYRTKITIQSLTRKHGGTYVIKAENDSGRDEATVEILVLDKPGKPEGPLKISDVHKEGCQLKWNAPLDDGGVPIDFYQVEKMDKETGRWVPCGRAKDTFFEVANLEPGQEYTFRVTAINEEGESEPLEADKSIIAKNPFGK